MKLRSFTLIEMMIVIVLIGIMLSITLNISGNQTKELRFRIARENFLTNYNAFVIKAITTNDSDLQLSFVQGTSNIITSNSPSLYFEPTPDTIINNIIVGWVSRGTEWIFPTQILSFDPEQWECVLNPWAWEQRDTEVEIVLKYRQWNVATKSYIIDLTTCKMRRWT
jgi:prepilin-type N-terminal cleavage/methylation domain-containing protein